MRTVAAAEIPSDQADAADARTAPFGLLIKDGRTGKRYPRHHIRSNSSRDSPDPHAPRQRRGGDRCQGAGKGNDGLRAAGDGSGHRLRLQAEPSGSRRGPHPRRRGQSRMDGPVPPDGPGPTTGGEFSTKATGPPPPQAPPAPEASVTSKPRPASPTPTRTATSPWSCAATSRSRPSPPRQVLIQNRYRNPACQSQNRHLLMFWRSATFPGPNRKRPRRRWNAARPGHREVRPRCQARVCRRPVATASRRKS